MLCRTCRMVMCDDCREIADEYAELLQNWKQRCAVIEARNSEVEKELARLKRERDAYEGVARMGLPVLMRAWLDSLSVEDMEKLAQAGAT